MRMGFRDLGGTRGSSGRPLHKTALRQGDPRPSEALAGFACRRPSRQPWQFDGLSAAARDLFQSVEEASHVRATGRPVKELERRLLVSTRQVHTESGRHETKVESWNEWAAHSGCKAHASVSKARLVLAHAGEIVGGHPRRTSLAS